MNFFETERERERPLFPFPKEGLKKESFFLFLFVSKTLNSLLKTVSPFFLFFLGWTKKREILEEGLLSLSLSLSLELLLVLF